MQQKKAKKNSISTSKSEVYNFLTPLGVKMYAEGKNAEKVVNYLNQQGTLDIIAICIKYCQKNKINSKPLIWGVQQ